MAIGTFFMPVYSACCPVTSKESEGENVLEKDPILGSFAWPPSSSETLSDTASAPGGPEDDLMTLRLLKLLLDRACQPWSV